MTFSVNEILAPSRCVSKSRLAFTQVQEQLDHVLFKMAPTGIRTEERLDHSFLQRRDGGLRRRDEEALPSSFFIRIQITRYRHLIELISSSGLERTPPV
ncbi:hypothetical protein LXL04_004179 [Taraxacum kok-saghyz]